MKRAKEYRKQAKELLDYRIFGRVFLYGVLVVLVLDALVSLIGAIPVAGFIAVLIIGGPIAFGSVRIFLRFVRKEDEKPNLNYVFDGFKEKFGDAFITELLETVYILLWSLLFIIPGIIKSYSYSLSMYLVHERDMEGNEAITKSREMMDGHKWQLFCLDLSFIGWYFVGALCLGVGVLWAETYHKVAQTAFFEDLLKQPEVIDVK